MEKRFLRRRAGREAQKAFFHLPLFPAINIACLGGVVVIFAAMFSNPAQRETAAASLGTCLLFVVIDMVRRRRRPA